MITKEEPKKEGVEAYGEASPSALHSDSFIQLAEAHRSQGHYEEAIETCRKGLEKTPDSLPGRLFLGKCYLEKKMVPEAKKELEKVAEEMEKCFSVYKLLSQVYLHELNVDKALEVLKKSLYLPSAEEAPGQKILPPETDLLRREPAPPPVTEAISPPHDSQSILKAAEAEKSLQAAIQTDTLAEIYIKQGHLEKALLVYQEILGREPENTAIKEKCEELKKRIEAERKAASQQKVIHHLEQWLSAVSPKDDETNT